jgi:excisionase family DNA binding protein
MEDKLISPEELAKHLGIPIRTVYTMNCDGTAPPRYRVGRSVRYRMSEVEQWLKARLVPTH